MHQNPCSFREYFAEKLHNYHQHQAPIDPCLIISQKVVANCYVDDLIIWTMIKEENVDLTIQLDAKGIDFEKDHNAAGFLWVKSLKFISQQDIIGFIKLLALMFDLK